MFSLLKQKHHNKGRPRMFILHDILEKLKKEFDHSRKGKERGSWTFCETVKVASLKPLLMKLFILIF